MRRAIVHLVVILLQTRAQDQNVAAQEVATATGLAPDVSIQQHLPEPGAELAEREAGAEESTTAQTLAEQVGHEKQQQAAESEAARTLSELAELRAELKQQQDSTIEMNTKSDAAKDAEIDSLKTKVAGLEAELNDRVAQLESKMRQRFADQALYDQQASLLELWGESLKQFVVHRLTPASDPVCTFSYMRARCEPKCDCQLDYKLGDYSPTRMCRLIPELEKVRQLCIHLTCCQAYQRGWNHGLTVYVLRCFALMASPGPYVLGRQD